MKKVMTVTSARSGVGKEVAKGLAGQLCEQRAPLL